MPSYDFFCREHPATMRDVFLTFADVEAKAFPICPTCRNRMEIDVAASLRSQCVSGVGFAPYYNRGLGMTVTSAADQDAKAKRLGLIPMGDKMPSPVPQAGSGY